MLTDTRDEQYTALVEGMAGAKTPTQLADLRADIATWYAYLAAVLETVLVRKADLWPRIRETTTSDTQADHRWTQSADGLIEIKCRLRLKAMEKLMSAIKTRIDVAQGEARNQY